jgi:anti-sigma-K factor RskA
MSYSKHFDPARVCDTIHDLIPEYAFGLTTPEETRLVESNLALCPEAAAQLADFRRLQEEMRSGVAQLEPPPPLEQRLMAAIAAPNPTAKPRPHPGWLAAAAALLALVVTNVYWLARVDDLIRRHDELVARLDGQSDNAFVLTNANNLRWVRLPSENNENTSAFLMWDADSDTGLLYAHGFPRLAPGKTYQLWLTRGDERVNAGTFQVDDQGNAALLFHSPAPIDEFTWARVTDEPQYGSDQPTGNVVVHGEL